MTLPKDVQDAMDAADNDCGLELTYLTRDEWHSIRAHLLSQDAQNQRLREVGRKAVLANADLRQQTHVLESRLAAADALLLEMYQDMGHVIFSGNTHVDRWMGQIDAHLQGAGDEAQD